MNSNLSDQQKAALNRLLAECLGWHPIEDNWEFGCIDPHGSRWAEPPDYCSDLNPCAEVEAGLTDGEYHRFTLHLSEQAWDEHPEPTPVIPRYRLCFSAKPWRRAIALLRTLGRGAEVDRILNSTTE